MTDKNFKQQHGYFLEELTIGLSADYEKTITEADVAAFAVLSGDTNPLHFDEDFASQTRFKTRIVHGMLTTSLWSTIIGTRLPGPGSVYMRQETRYLRPVHIGETVSAKATLVEIDTARQRVVLDTECTVGGTPVATGRALIWVPRRSKFFPSA